MATLFDLINKHKDWNTKTIISIHAYGDFNNSKVLYHGTLGNMPAKFGYLMIRSFDISYEFVYIELEKDEENKL